MLYTSTSYTIIIFIYLYFLVTLYFSYIKKELSKSPTLFCLHNNELPNLKQNKQRTKLLKYFFIVSPITCNIIIF